MTSKERVLNSIAALPPFPAVARRLLGLCKDPDASVDDMLQVVQYDQAVTANCLRLCNSSYFCLRKKVHSLQEAVLLLGSRNLLKLVFASGCLRFYTGAHDGYGLERGDLWRHSVACAIFSQLLWRQAGRTEDSLVFTTGLLHDLGKVALHRYVRDEFDTIVALVQERGLSFVEAERAILGIDHAELGGIIGDTWRFPPLLVEAIRLHHENGTGRGQGTDDLVPWVRLSNLLANMVGVGTGADGMACQADGQLLTLCGLGDEDLQVILAAFPGEMQTAESIMTLGSGVRGASDDG